jgi:NAD(P)-dependent dehydrogenase (short-subunit alcohol dehydrogenase family)
VPDDHDRPVYLVVGAGPGMGLWCASRFAAHGWRTVLVGHEVGAVESVADQLAEMHPDAPRALTCVADAGNPIALRASIEALALPRVDVAHYNVSTWVPGALDSDLAAVSAGLDAGAVSALAMVQAVQPRMSAAGQGAVIFTGSGAADAPSAASLGLGMQKAALRNLAIGLQPVLAPQGIRVLHFTIYGVLAPDSPFSAPVISARIAGLVLDASGTGLRPLAATPHWDPVVPYRG